MEKYNLRRETATIRIIIRVSPRLYQSRSLKDVEDPAKIFSSGRRRGEGSDFAIPRINIPRLPEELLSLH